MLKRNLPRNVIAEMLGPTFRSLPSSNPHWGNHSIDIYRYHGNSFEDATHVRLRRTTDGPFPGRFVPDFGGLMSLRHGYRMANSEDRARFQGDPLYWALASRRAQGESAPIRSLLQLEQDFPLRQMLARGAVDTRTAEEMQKAETWLEPTQVSFFSVSEMVTEEDLRQKFGHLPKDAEMSEDGVHRRLKRASAWLVTGQDHLGRPLEVPASKAGFALDRKEGWGLVKDASLWEIGRAAQTTDGAFEEAAKQAILQAAREAFASGRSPSQGLLVATAWDDAHAKVFQDQYGMTPVATKEGKTLFVARLLDLAERANVVSASEPLSYALLGAPEWSLEQGLRFLSEAKDLRRTSAILTDSQGKRRAGVEVRDFTSRVRAPHGSPMPLWFLAFSARYAHQIPDAPRYEGMLEHLVSAATEDPLFDRYHDDLPRLLELQHGQKIAPEKKGMPWKDFLQRSNAIEVLLGDTGVGLNEAKHALVFALKQARARLAESGVPDGDTVLSSSHVHFALVTSEFPFGPQLESILGPVGRYAWSDKRRISRGLWGAAFTVEQVRSMEAELTGASEPLKVDQRETAYYYRKVSIH